MHECKSEGGALAHPAREVLAIASQHQNVAAKVFAEQ